MAGLFDGANCNRWLDMHRTNQDFGGMHDTISFEQTNCDDDLTKMTADSLVNNNFEDRGAPPGKYCVFSRAQSQSVRGDYKKEFQV